MKNEVIYTVRRMGLTRGVGHYEVAKWTRGNEPEDLYDVTIYPDKRRPYCNCFGFRQQKYPAEEHKHIKLVRTWIGQQEPPGQQYKLIGGSQDPTVEPVDVF